MFCQFSASASHSNHSRSYGSRGSPYRWGRYSPRRLFNEIFLLFNDLLILHDYLLFTFSLLPLFHVFDMIRFLYCFIYNFPLGIKSISDSDKFKMCIDRVTNYKSILSLKALKGDFLIHETHFARKTYVACFDSSRYLNMGLEPKNFYFCVESWTRLTSLMVQHQGIYLSLHLPWAGCMSPMSSLNNISNSPFSQTRGSVGSFLICYFYICIWT